MLERVLVNDDWQAKPERIRVTESFRETGLLEIVDAWTTSRAATAQETEVFAKLVLTRDQALWLRDTLTEALERAK